MDGQIAGEKIRRGEGECISRKSWGKARSVNGKMEICRGDGGKQMGMSGKGRSVEGMIGGDGGAAFWRRRPEAAATAAAAAGRQHVDN